MNQPTVPNLFILLHCSSVFGIPNSSLSNDNQQDENAVFHLIQRITWLDAVISKRLNIEIESLKATNIECSLPLISTRMLMLEKMVNDGVLPS